MKPQRDALANTVYSEPFGISVNDRLRADWIGLTIGFGRRREPRHIPFHGLNLLLEGEAICRFDGRRPFRIQPPAALLYHAGMEQQFSGNPKQCWRSRYLLLTGGWVDDWVRFGWWPSAYRVIPLKDPGFAERMHQSLLEAVANKNRGALERAKTALMDWVCRLHSAAQESSSENAREPFNALVEQWRERPEQPVDLRGTARELGMSYSLFRETFKERFHTSPYEYHLRLRLEKGRTLLGESDELVKQIALKVGFRNVETFQRHFVRRMGISPARYRKQSRAIETEHAVSQDSELTDML